LISIAHRLPFLAKIIANHKVTIAEGKFTVNNNSLSELVRIGKIKIDPNHPAEMLVNQSDSTDETVLSNSRSFTKTSYHT